ncbi:hypothetical protein AB4Z50_35080 [Paenibacillus sp. 2TAB26]|uniref:hypothetical protein n=1 Tax=Paenibacillus sp. 2TAB26 TaxID=3233005 RepID=UPI003F9B66A2
MSISTNNQIFAVSIIIFTIVVIIQHLHEISKINAPIKEVMDKLNLGKVDETLRLYKAYMILAESSFEKFRITKLKLKTYEGGHALQHTVDLISKLIVPLILASFTIFISINASLLVFANSNKEQDYEGYKESIVQIIHSFKTSSESYSSFFLCFLLFFSFLTLTSY